MAPATFSWKTSRPVVMVRYSLTKRPRPRFLNAVGFIAGFKIFRWWVEQEQKLKTPGLTGVFYSGIETVLSWFR